MLHVTGPHSQGITGSYQCTATYNTVRQAAEAMLTTRSLGSLWKLLQRDSDVDIVITSADDTTELVPGHTSFLGHWSAVMQEAIDTAKSGSTQGKRISIPITDTSKDEWLMLMSFVYPAQPRSHITWENLEALLRNSDKFCMPALLEDCGEFLAQNAKSLSFEPNSKTYLWKWIFIADRYRLVEVAKKCIDAQTDLQKLMMTWPLDKQQYPSFCKGQQLSAEVARHLLVTIRSKAVLIRINVPYCRCCKDYNVPSHSVRVDSLYVDVCDRCRYSTVVMIN